jgi:hypothetical protein
MAIFNSYVSLPEGKCSGFSELHLYTFVMTEWSTIGLLAWKDLEAEDLLRCGPFRICSLWLPRAMCIQHMPLVMRAVNSSWGSEWATIPEVCPPWSFPSNFQWKKSCHWFEWGRIIQKKRPWFGIHHSPFLVHWYLENRVHHWFQDVACTLCLDTALLETTSQS